MARTVLPIVGAVVGAFFGAPQLGYAIGSVIGNAVDPQRIKGPRIGDATLQTSQEGAPRPIIYGTAAVMGNLIDRGPLNKVITEERQGKGGGPVVENESLFMTFAIRICEGPIGGILRIWEDERLVYDVRPESEIVQDSARYAQGFTLYLGDENQLPDPDLETIHGVGNTPAHRGSAYIVFKEKNLTDRRGSIPQFRFEVDRCPPPIVIPPRWLLKLGPYDEVPALSQGIFGSPDGVQWTSVDPVAGGGALEHANPGFNGTILLTSNGQTERVFSGDEGLTFSSVITGGPTPSAGGGRAVFYNGIWYRSGGNQLISISSNNGTTFTTPTSDTNSRANDVAVTASGRVYAVYEDFNIHYTDTQGATWVEGPTILSSGLPTGVIRIRRVSSGTIVVLCTAGSPADNTLRISVSRNNGSSFTESDYRFPTDNEEAVDVCEWGVGKIAAVNRAGEVAISNDDGQTWFTSPLAFPTLCRGANGDVEKLLVCGNGGQLWVTYDGATWTQLSTAYGDADILWVSQVP